jgi:hypothetical protein
MKVKCLIVVKLTCMHDRACSRNEPRNLTGLVNKITCDEVLSPFKLRDRGRFGKQLELTENLQQHTVRKLF